MRSLGMWVVLISALALAACGGGDASVQQPTASPKAFVSAAEAMDASADSFQTQVTSFEGTMSIGFSANGQDFSTGGDIKFKAPDSAYVKMNMPGIGDFEVLLADAAIYFGMDGKWYKGDASALGIDLSQFEKYAQDRGPVDYANTLKGMKDLVKLSDETIDGKSYSHYHGALDLSSLSDEIPADVIDPALLDRAADAINTTAMDVYVDPDTMLPRRYKMTMMMDVNAEAFTMNMTMDFVKYNEDVGIPDVPADAKPFTFPTS